MKPSPNETPEDKGKPVLIIPIEESADVMSIRLAALYMDDGNQFWLETMPQILATYHLTPTDYWNLTVAEHQMLHIAVQPPEGTDGG